VLPSAKVSPGFHISGGLRSHLQFGWFLTAIHGRIYKRHSMGEAVHGENRGQERHAPHHWRAIDAFEWDEAKRQKNIDAHAIDFEDAATIFSRPYLRSRSERNEEYGSLRSGSWTISKSPSFTQFEPGVAGSSPPGERGPMSERNITRRLAADLKRGKTNRDRLRGKTDEEIADAVDRDRDTARIDIDWSRADVVFPEPKQVISIRLDRDIVEYFKRSGRGYQTKINAVLRSYVQHEKRYGKG
jgi:uncharacterized protein (DUF4415 family)